MSGLLALGIVVLIMGSTWWFGLWSNILNLLNFFIAALVASSFYENLAYTLEGFDPSYQYLTEFVSLWAIFVASFVFLRLVTDILSPVRLRFNPLVDYIGRTVVCLWLALSFLSFAFFSLHLAPLAPDAIYADPNQKELGIGPDRLWLAMIQSRSRGALSAYRQSNIFGDYQLTAHPDDLNLDARVFDPQGNFIFEQAARRLRISKNTTLRVAE